VPDTSELHDDPAVDGIIGRAGDTQPPLVMTAGVHRRKRAAVLVAPLVVALAVIATLVGWPSSSIDRVARARAAVAVQPGAILHQVTTVEVTVGGAAASRVQEEDWIAQAGSPAWRMIRHDLLQPASVVEASANNDSASIYDANSDTLFAPAPGTMTSHVDIRPGPDLAAELASSHAHFEGTETVNGVLADRISLGDCIYFDNHDTADPVAIVCRHAAETVTTTFERYETVPDTAAAREAFDERVQHPTAVINTDPSAYFRAAEKAFANM
jgi:hypothetical protein